MGAAVRSSDDGHGEHAGIGPLASPGRRASRAGGCFLHSSSTCLSARGVMASGGVSGQGPHSEQSKFVNTQSASAPQRKSSAEARRSTGQATTARMQARGTRPESRRPTKQRLPEIAMGRYPGATIARGYLLGGSMTGAIVTDLAMYSKSDSSKSYPCSNEYYNSTSDANSINSRMGAAEVLGGLAAAAAVTAGVLFYFEGQPVSVAPAVGGMAGALAGVRFRSRRRRRGYGHAADSKQSRIDMRNL